jgi:hypothetical protein
MGKGYFTVKNKKPDGDDIDHKIGLAKNNWNMLLQYLTDELKLKGEFKFYGVNYGWALRFNKSGKSLIALYPDKDCFMVQIILNKNQVDSAITRVLNRQIVKLIREKVSIHEGKWIYIKIDDISDLKDIMTLIKIRMEIK